MANNLIALHDQETSHNSDCLLPDAPQVHVLHYHRSNVPVEYSNESVSKDAMPAPLHSAQTTQEINTSLATEASMGSKTFEQFKIPKSIQQRQHQNLHNVAPTDLTTYFRDRFKPSLDNGPLRPALVVQSRNNSSPEPGRNVASADKQLINTTRWPSGAGSGHNADHLAIEQVVDTETAERNTVQHQNATHRVRHTDVTDAHVQITSELSGLDILCSAALNEQEKIKRLQSASRPTSVHSDGAADPDNICAQSRSASQRTTPDSTNQPAETTVEQQVSSTHMNMQRNNQLHHSPLYSQGLYIPYNMAGLPNIPNNQNSQTGLAMSLAAPTVTKQKDVPVSGALARYNSRGIRAQLTRPSIAYQLHPSYIARRPPVGQIVSPTSQPTACTMPELSERARMRPSAPLRGYMHAAYSSGPNNVSNSPLISANGEKQAFDSNHMQCPIHSVEASRKVQGYSNLVKKVSQTNSYHDVPTTAQHLLMQNITPEPDSTVQHHLSSSQGFSTCQSSTCAQGEFNKFVDSNELETGCSRLRQTNIHSYNSVHSGSKTSETYHANSLTRLTDNHPPEVTDVHAPSTSIQLQTDRHIYKSVPNIPTDFDHINVDNNSQSRTQSAPNTASNGKPPITSIAPIRLINKDDSKLIPVQKRITSSGTGQIRRKRFRTTDGDELPGKKRRHPEEQDNKLNKITQSRQANRDQPVEADDTISGKSLTKFVPSCDTFVSNSIQISAFTSQGQELTGNTSDAGYRQRWKKPTNADIECKLCQHRVKYSVPWKKHIREMHWDLVENFVCKECIMPFACKEAFMVHVKTLHPKMYPCNLIPEKHLQPIIEKLRTYKGRNGQLNGQPLETSPDGLTQAGHPPVLISDGNPQFQPGSVSSIMPDISKQTQLHSQQINISSTKPSVRSQPLTRAQPPLIKPLNSVVQSQPFVITNQQQGPQQQQFLKAQKLQVRQQYAEQTSVGPQPQLITPEQSVRQERPDVKHQQPHINVMSQQQFVNIHEPRICPQQPTVKPYQPVVQRQIRQQPHLHSFSQPTVSLQVDPEGMQYSRPQLGTASCSMANENFKSDVHDDITGTHIYATSSVSHAQLGQITSTASTQNTIVTNSSSDMPVLGQHLHGKKSVTPKVLQSECVLSDLLPDALPSSTFDNLFPLPSKNKLHQEIEVHSQANLSEDLNSKNSPDKGKKASGTHSEIMLAASPKPLAIALSEANLVPASHRNVNLDNLIAAITQTTTSDSQYLSPHLNHEENSTHAAPKDIFDLPKTENQSQLHSPRDPVTDSSRLDCQALSPQADGLSCKPEPSTLMLKSATDDYVSASCNELLTDRMFPMDGESDSINNVNRHIQNTPENMTALNDDDVSNSVLNKTEFVESPGAMNFDQDDMRINSREKESSSFPSEIQSDQKSIQYKKEDLERKYTVNLADTGDKPVEIKVEPSAQSDAENDDASTKSYANSPNRFQEVAAFSDKGQMSSEDTSPLVLSADGRKLESPNNSIYSVSDAHGGATNRLSQIHDPSSTLHMTNTRHTITDGVNQIVQCMPIPIITPPDSDCSESPPTYIEVGSRDTKLNIRPKIVKWSKKRKTKRAKTKSGNQKAKFFFPKLVKYARKPSKSRFKEESLPIYGPLDEANDSTLPDLISCEEAYTRLTKCAYFGIVEDNEQATKFETWSQKPDVKDTPLQVNTKANISPTVRSSVVGDVAQEDMYKSHQVDTDNNTERVGGSLKDNNILGPSDAENRSKSDNEEVTTTQPGYAMCSDVVSTMCSDRDVSVMDTEETFSDVSAIRTSPTNDDDTCVPNMESGFCTKTCKIALQRMPLLNTMSERGYVTLGNDGSLTNSPKPDDGDISGTLALGPVSFRRLRETQSESETGREDMILNHHKKNDGIRELESVVNEQCSTSLACFQKTESIQVNTYNGSSPLPQRITQPDATIYPPSSVNTTRRQDFENGDIVMPPTLSNQNQPITDHTHSAEPPVLLREQNDRNAAATTVDQIIGTETGDQIIGTEAEDQIIGTETGDQIIGTETGDQIIGTETEDQIIGTETEDLDTETGDQIIGTETGDQIIGTETGDQIIGTETGDQIIGIETGDQIIGTETGDQIIGTETEDLDTETEDQIIYTETPVSCRVLKPICQHHLITFEKPECFVPRIVNTKTISASSSISEGATEPLSNSNPPMCNMECDNSEIQSTGEASPLRRDMVLGDTDDERLPWEEQQLSNNDNLEIVYPGNDCEHAKEGRDMVDEHTCITESVNVRAKPAMMTTSEIIVSKIETPLKEKSGVEIDDVSSTEPVDGKNNFASPRPISGTDGVPSKESDITIQDSSDRTMKTYNDHSSKHIIPKSNDESSQKTAVDSSGNDMIVSISATVNKNTSTDISNLVEESTSNSFEESIESANDEPADTWKDNENNLSKSHAVVSGYVKEHRTHTCSEPDIVEQPAAPCVDYGSANDCIDDNGSDSDGTKEWGCLLCTYSSNDKAVKAHITKQHIVEKHFYCPKCSHNSLAYSDVEHHILDFHKDVTAVVLSKRCTRLNDLVSSLSISLPNETKWKNVKAKVQKAEKMSAFIKTRIDLNDYNKYVCHVCCKLIRTDVLIRRHVALHWKEELERSLESKPQEVNSDNDILLELFNNKKIRMTSRRNITKDQYVPPPSNKSSYASEYLVCTSPSSEQQSSSANLNSFEVMKPSKSKRRKLKVKLKRVNSSFLSTEQSTTTMTSVLHSPTSPSSPYTWDSPVPNSPTKTGCFSLPSTQDKNSTSYASSQTSQMNGVQPGENTGAQFRCSTSETKKLKEVCYEEALSPAISEASQTSCCTCSSTVTMPYQTATNRMTSGRAHVYYDCYRSYVVSDIKLSMRPVVQIEHLRVT